MNWMSYFYEVMMCIRRERMTHHHVHVRCCLVMNCREPQAGDDDDVLHSMEASLDLLAGKIAIFVDLAHNYTNYILHRNHINRRCA